MNYSSIGVAVAFAMLVCFHFMKDNCNVLSPKKVLFILAILYDPLRSQAFKFPQ